MHQQSVVHLAMPLDPHIIVGLTFCKIDDSKAPFSETVNLSEPGADDVHTGGEVQMDPLQDVAIAFSNRKRQFVISIRPLRRKNRA